jgi:hypothetical protein
MAMFARRVLQSMLDHLAAHLPLAARKKLMQEMNRHSSSARGFEWETALLFGFSHVGKIDYETPSSQGSRPDIVFAEDSKTPIRFTADIATVSDEGLENENPAMRLSMALTRLKQKYKLPGSTHYTIKGEATGPHYRHRKMRLKLPPDAEIEKMLEKHVARRRPHHRIVRPAAAAPTRPIEQVEQHRAAQSRARAWGQRI